jgi:lysophospholipase L1-like esterase
VRSRLRAAAALAAAALAGEGCPTAPATIRLACVGDSITFGSGVSAGQSYPDLLATQLGATWTVGNFGDSGKTVMKAPAPGNVSYWSTRTFTDSQGFAPDVVVIMLGTNDAKPANWRAGANSFEADYQALLSVYAGLPRRPCLFAVLPPPALETSFADGKVLEQELLPIIRRVAAAGGAELIDVFGAFAADPRRYFGRGDGQDVGDGTHPNAAGARLIAETVAAALPPGQRLTCLHE